MNAVKQLIEWKMTYVFCPQFFQTFSFVADALMETWSRWIHLPLQGNDSSTILCQQLLKIANGQGNTIIIFSFNRQSDTSQNVYK